MTHSPTKTDLSNSTVEDSQSTVATADPVAQSVTPPAASLPIYQIIKDDTYQLAEDTLATRGTIGASANGASAINVSADFLPRSQVFVAPLDSNPTPAAVLSSNTVASSGTLDAEASLTKTPKSEALTDDVILQASAQLNAPNEILENDHALPGRNIEHMEVATKQWLLTLNWERTLVNKSGLFNKLKGNKQTLDLDLACLLCNRYGEVVERIWFKNVRDEAESVRHLGDELLGVRSALAAATPEPAQATPNYAKPTYQEQLAILFRKIPPTIYHMAMVISCYSGHALSSTPSGYCELSDDEGNPILHLDLTTLDDCPALWLATLTRVGDSWRFNADLQPLGQFSMEDMCRIIAENLSRTAN